MAGALVVHQSNAVEALADALAERLRDPLPTPLEREVLVVGGAGIERWLSPYLAKKLGVFANGLFVTPRVLVEELLEPASESQLSNAPTVVELTWALAAALQHRGTPADFAELDHYLRNDPDRSKLLQLAAAIARLFEAYPLYRPTLVQSWLAGDDGEEHARAGWQPELFRQAHARVARLRGRGGASLGLLPERLRAFERQVEQALARGRTPPKLPSRISVFLPGPMAPLLYAAWSVLARVTVVHLYVLTPSRHYLGDLLGRKDGRTVRTARTQRPSREEVMPEEEDRQRGASDASASDRSRKHDTLEATGHPLLASLGRMAREQSRLLAEQPCIIESAEDLFVERGTDRLLHQLQDDLLTLRNLELPRGTRRPVRADDRSIVVHACSSPRREVEVLAARLLDLLDGDQTLQPHDIVVLATDMDAYAPHIERVFGGGSPALPFRIADRARVHDAVVRAFLRLLDEGTGRATATGILDLLECEPIARRFGIGAADLPQLTRWIIEGNVHGAFGSAHRAALQQPEDEVGTWDHALARWLLGYAATSERQTWMDLLPFEGATADAALLGKFSTFYAALSELHGQLATPKSVVAFCELLQEARARFLADDEAFVEAHRALRDALQSLQLAAATAAFDADVGFLAIRDRLLDILSEQRSAQALFSGGITVARLQPTRVFPCRVLCLLGMNDGDYPRTQSALSFDRMAEAPEPGDRSPREEDRSVFLECLLAARDALFVSYVGRSERDEGVLPPSVLVSELLDTIEEGFEVADNDGPDGSRSLRDLLHRLAPLHAYDAPRGSGGLIDACERGSFDARVVAASEAPRQPQEVRFFRAPLPPRTLPNPLPSEPFARFFGHPADTLLRSLGVERTTTEATLPEDAQPLVWAPLRRWQLGDRLLRRWVELDEEPQAQLLRLTGDLPPGTLGNLAFEALHAELTELHRTVSEHWQQPAARFEGELVLAQRRILVQLEGLQKTHRLDYGFGHFKSSRLLEQWVRHLLANALATTMPTMAASAVRTVLIARDPKQPQRGFRPFQGAEAPLRELLALFEDGLRYPLPFLPTTSLAFARECAAGRSVEEAMQRVEAVLNEECAEESVRLCFGDLMDPAQRRAFFHETWHGHTFVEVAKSVCDPLLAHEEAPSKDHD